MERLTASLPRLFRPTSTSFPLGATYLRMLIIGSSLPPFFLGFGGVPPLFPLPPLDLSRRLISAAAPLPAGLTSLASTSSALISSRAKTSSLPPRPELSSRSENSTCSRYSASRDAASSSGSTAPAVLRCFLAFLYSASAAATGPLSASIGISLASPVSKSYTVSALAPCRYPCWYAMISSARVLTSSCASASAICLRKEFTF
mmetsp:Transcript_14155/g.57580  ORF Transcript_14155/g.57580 Transcript_14155/m.57580 type:complete len:203 (-) Transcript_14155:166-774(-)